jgi:hypothetical protein
MTKIKTDMVKHLHKLKKCEHKHIDTLNLSDDNIIQQSLIPIHSYNNDLKKHECEICMKRYSCIKSLHRHNKTCIKTENQSIPNKTILEDNKINNHSSVNIENIENIENFINIENLNLFSTENKSNEINIKEIKEKLSEINPNISVDNINVKNINLVGFDEKWNLSHIDDNLKFLFMFSEYKYTDLLKEILQNIINLNVVLDKYSEKGFVYINETKKFESREQSEIIEDTLHKLQEQLYEIYEQIRENKKIFFDRKLLNKVVCDIKHKHNDYFKLDKNGKKKISKNFIDIFNNKYQESLENYTNQKNNFRI